MVFAKDVLETEGVRTRIRKPGSFHYRLQILPHLFSVIQDRHVLEDALKTVEY